MGVNDKKNPSHKKFKILTLNPGSTSTKIGVYENDKVIFESTVRHSSKSLETYHKIWDQYNFRKEEILKSLEQHNISLESLDAVVGRGGLLKPIPSGVYLIDETMIEDARIGYQGQHVSNLACVIAYSIGWTYNIPALIVDPPSVDDLEPLAKISGWSEIKRSSLFHALNIFATARAYANDYHLSFKELNLIVAHLGGGISVAALKNGHAINVNNALFEGPFSPERCGDLPIFPLLDVAYSGKYTLEEMKKRLVGKGGFVSYFGTSNIIEVEELIHSGSHRHKLILEACAYQVAEEIGARATNLAGKVDAIILTGGLANGKLFTDLIEERVGFLSKVVKYPGEKELEALALGGLRVLQGEEVAKTYTLHRQKIGVVMWTNTDEYNFLITTLEETLQLHGFKFRTHEGNVDIIYKNVHQSEISLSETLSYFQHIGVTLIIAVGSPVASRLKDSVTNSLIPIVFIGISNTSLLGEIETWPKNKIFATCFGVPLKEQIEETLLKVHPNIQRLGYIYSTGELLSEIQLDEIKKISLERGIHLFALDVQSEDSLVKAPEFFHEKKVEWVVIEDGTIIANASKNHLAAITEAFPTTCLLESTLKKGGLMGAVASWKQVCQRGALIVVKLLNNEVVYTPYVLPKQRTLLINQTTAKKLAIMPLLEEKMKNFTFIDSL